ncbi:MAG TPA: hypothetical protein PKZ02_02425 [Candidatus Paceibacterota bacterium]|nr:hypothetical protein [Candidatus Paceibacterota bacterium]
MKKSLFIVLTLVGVIGFSAPLLVGAADPIQTVNITAEEVPGIITNIATWFYRVVLVVAVFFALLAAFNFLTGDPKKIQTARHQLLYVVIGVVVTLVSFGIVSLINDVLTQAK